MDINDIKKEWKEDSVISPVLLLQEALKTVSLHSKYYNMYLDEKVVLLDLQKEYDLLYKLKRVMYINGASKEDEKKGWQLPPIGKILKTEVDHYLKVDRELCQAKKELELQEVKCKFLVDIINFLHYNRKGIISDAIDLTKFHAGE